VGAWALSLIGLFNIAGSFASGWAIGRWRMKSVLSLIYAARAAAVLGFMFAPKTATTFMVFAVVLGFTYLSTVPPTVGLVGKLHGMRYVATLFGIVMLSHQVGGFLVHGHHAGDRRGADPHADPRSAAAQAGTRHLGVHMAYKRILVPIDGSPTSARGLREAIGFAKAQKARLQLVHVVDVHNAMLAGLSSGDTVTDLAAALEERGRRLLDSAAALVRKSGLACETVLLESLTGPAAEPIVRQARKWRADLIVIGTHGRRGLKRLVMGSDAEQIVRNAPVPVMLVRQP
jgi:nucleotide-binding universal stress UspA family protein